MRLFQKGLGVKGVTFATRPRPIAPNVRSPLRQVRQPRRCNSSTPERPPAQSKPAETGSPNTNASAKPSEPPSSSATPQAPNTAAAAAGAATTPTAANAVARPRGFREIIKAGPLGRMGRWYTRAQERKPYTVQLWSSIVIYLCGDLSAQLLFPEQKSAKKDQDESKTVPGEESEEEKEQGFGSTYDPWRTVRHLIVGAGSSIPSYNWFWFLHNNFNFASKFLSILTKVTVQQMCFTPVFNTYFFSVHSLLGGATFEETWERLKKALPVSVTNSVKLWPAVTAFSLLYVPPQFRNVFSGVIAVGWQTYLSWLNQKAKHEVETAELAAAAQESSAPGSANSQMITAAGTA
ncbi:hypothetical protein N7532_011406 [Penicillium argentinense]|uniref:Uncharacterized protein n=1 Tax=Penicillium argentinense TaxID=1131581 RepID=A0A9W9JUT2_9EURO|nr:uncharacterized protein N7532_011406 [Penicillium argentinense]KAJ5082363.1 hypothetical protein N7532_011406 [Penicillium argentinense]